jgi:hypothetical protein
MGKSIRYDGGPLNGIIQLPVNTTVELLNALESAGAAMAAISYATMWLSQAMRRGQQFTIFECAGVTIIATLQEDADGWAVLVEPCNASAFRSKGTEEQCSTHP